MLFAWGSCRPPECGMWPAHLVSPILVHTKVKEGSVQLCSGMQSLFFLSFTAPLVQATIHFILKLKPLRWRDQKKRKEKPKANDWRRSSGNSVKDSGASVKKIQCKGPEV